MTPVRGLTEFFKSRVEISGAKCGATLAKAAKRGGCAKSKDKEPCSKKPSCHGS